jgi:hypothetical protein
MTALFDPATSSHTPWEVDRTLEPGEVAAEIAVCSDRPVTCYPDDLGLWVVGFADDPASVARMPRLYAVAYLLGLGSQYLS